jgi:hypothetical protein
MTKQQRREKQLNKHYEIMQNLARFHGSNLDGKYITTKLLQLEKNASIAALNWCNGVFTQENYEDATVTIKPKAQALFNNKLEGFFINSDPRGYALKITSEQTQILREKGIILHTDWGGYGILSPDIDTSPYFVD